MLSLAPSAAVRAVAATERNGMSLHDRFDWHDPDHQHSHWENGHFVSTCTVCGRPMIKLPGLPWRVREARR